MYERQSRQIFGDCHCSPVSIILMSVFEVSRYESDTQTSLYCITLDEIYLQHMLIYGRLIFSGTVNFMYKY